jgi:hypothetical protein
MPIFDVESHLTLWIDLLPCKPLSGLPKRVALLQLRTS